MDDHPVHTTPNHHPPKMNVLPTAAVTTFAFPSVFILVVCLVGCVRLLYAALADVSGRGAGDAGTGGHGGRPGPAPTFHT